MTPYNDFRIENKTAESPFNLSELNLYPMDKDKKPTFPQKKEQN